MTGSADRFYAAVRAVGRFWLWFFFKAVDVRHPERVPADGPVLLCINHPNNLIDSLLVGAVMPRKVHYLATAALFRNALAARFLRAVGAIPVYRKQDDPDKMDRNVDAFAACYAGFDEGGLVAIYPEGTTHSEARVQRIKTGAARLALEYEARRAGILAVIPVGLTFEARKSFRGRVLVSFGPLVPVSAYLAAYREDPAKAVDAVTTVIQLAMEAEVVHVDRIDEARLVRAVEDLYRGELARELREARGLGAQQIDMFRLSRSIVDAVEHFKRRDPARVERLWQRIQGYRALLAEHHVRDEAVLARLRRPRARRRLLTGWEAVLGFPVFAWGIVVNGLPYYVPRWIARRIARKETDYATTRFLAAVVAFPLFWGLESALVWRLLGGRAALLFALTLPLSGLLAFRYLVGAGRIRSQLRFGALAVRHGADARRLVAERQVLMAELERAKDEYLTETRGQSF
ncbi:MAG: 1-acyl-sn-glycerol-3-phosphate acyltransferase [Candidatus Rokubacteria bacterium]|nr:1-acyl-sn-glycerol-3-phosphate acyltransferase [Candidatus Rokubacteria bacterium]MBI3826494.1 1-acyl-sn-glycerol-3-phosphate acyltransferase [Candidatus Rokubacteria bacterium]